jgi:hypothetical protein
MVGKRHERGMAGKGKGTAWERHGMCELAFKKPSSTAHTRGVHLRSSALFYVLQHVSVELQQQCTVSVSTTGKQLP